MTVAVPPPERAAGTPTDGGAGAGARWASRWRAQLRRARPSTAVAVGLLVVHAVLAWLGRAFSINTGNDDAAYLLLARALRDFSYRDSYLLGAPMHSQYPPGFPAILAIASAPFGERLDVLLAVVLLFSVAALALLYDVVRRQSGVRLALCVLLLCALNPFLLDHAGTISSESPYLFFTVLTVWLAVREHAPPHATAPSWRWPVSIGTAAVCAAMTRSIGVTMIAALFVAWMWEGRRRRALVLAAGVTATVGAWLLWTTLAPEQVVGRSYIADATYDGGGDRPFVVVLIDRFINSLPVYVTSSVPSVLAQPAVAGTFVDNFAGLFVVLGFCLVGANVLWNRNPLVVAYVAFYAGVLALWPWRLTRFLVPIVPMLFWAMMAGAFRISERRRWLRPVPFLLVGGFAVSALMRDASAVAVAVTCDRTSPEASSRCYSDVQRAFFAALRYVRDSTPDTAAFLTVKEATVAYLTSHDAAARGAVDSRNARTMLRSLRSQGVSHVLLTPLRDFDMQYGAVLIEMCSSFRLEREFQPLTMILRIRAEGESDPPDACAALQRYARENGNWIGR